VSLCVGTTFTSFDEAKAAISEFCSKNCHPIRTDKKETVRGYTHELENNLESMD